MAKDYSHLGFVTDEETKKSLPKEKSSDLGFVSEPEEESYIKDILETLGAGAAGAAQGFTFGAGTKALGALEALGEAKDITDLPALYEKYKELSEKRKEQYEELSHEHPVASTVGEIGGAIFNPLPGATAKTAVELAKVPELAKILSISPRLATNIASGSLIGAGTSAITSEGKGADYAKDIGLGTLYGGAFGAGETAVLNRAEAFKDWLDKSPKLQRIFRAFQLSRGTPGINEGKPIGLTEKLTREGGGPAPIFKQLDEAKEKIANSYRNIYNFAKDEFNNFFDRYGNQILDPNSEEISNIVNVLNENKDKLKKYVKKDTIDKLTSGVSRIDPTTGEVIGSNYQGTVSDLYDLRGQLYDNIKSLKNPENIDRDIQDTLFGGKDKKGITNIIDEHLSNLFPDNYNKLKANVDKAASPLEMVINKITDDDLRTIRLSDLSKTKADKLAQNGFDTMFQKFGPGFGDQEQRYAFNALVDKYEEVLNHMNQNSPRFASKLEQALKGKVTGKKIGEEQIPEALENIKKSIEEKHAEALKSIAPPSKELEQVISDLKKSGKQKFSEIGMLSPKEVEQLGTQAGEDVSVLRTLLGEKSTQDAPQGILDLLSAPQGAGELTKLTATGAAGLGRRIRSIEDAARSLPSYIKTPVTKAVTAPIDLKKATVNELKQMAELLSKNSNPAISNIGRSAMTSLEENPTAKAAFLNTIMQNSTARDLLGLTVGKPEKK